MVHRRTHSGRYLLRASFQWFPKRFQSHLIRFLHYLPGTVQRGLGSSANKPHEPSPFAHLLQKTQSTHVLIKDKLNNLRNMFTFISNFTVLGIGLIIFSAMSDKMLEYKLIAYISLGLGICASVFFIKEVDEPSLVKACR